MSDETPARSSGMAALFALLAWAFPAAGHLALGRARRAGLFALVIATALVVGIRLDGHLYRPVEGQPLTRLATLGAMGVGAPTSRCATASATKGIRPRGPTSTGRPSCSPPA
jgi:hypothetical protein